MAMWRAPAHVSWQVLDDESVVLNLDSGVYYRLDEVGTQMFQALQESPDDQAALERLERRYDVTREVLRQDLATFVERLLEQGLIEPCPASGSSCAP